MTFNPAVSFAMLVSGRMKFGVFCGFVVAQLIGAAIEAGFFELPTNTKIFGKFAGLAIGLALGLVNIVGKPVDNCSVNPTRSFIPALWNPEAWPDSWIMVVGPLAVALLSALCREAISGYVNPPSTEG